MKSDTLIWVFALLCLLLGSSMHHSTFACTHNIPKGTSHGCAQDTVKPHIQQPVNADSGMADDSLHHQDEIPVKIESPDSIRTKEQIEPLPETVFLMGDISFADTVVLYDPGAFGEGTGDEPDVRYQNAKSALGASDYDAEKDTGYVSLGKGGTLVLRFIDNVLFDGPGPDLHIFKTSDDDVFVWISEDGTIFTSVGKTTKIQSSLDIRPYIRPGMVYPYIKLRDDPYQGEQEGPSLGADIDAVGAINAAIRITIEADNLFPVKKSRFTEDASRWLSQIADTIRQVPKPHVDIEVYTDSWGTEDYNLIITQSQAAMILNYFLDTEGLTEMTSSVLGLGEANPRASNDTEEGRRLNRRVELLIRAQRDMDENP